MHTIWFPSPVFTLFRRLVNVVSTLSISHQYYVQQKSLPSTEHEAEPKHPCPGAQPWHAFEVPEWLAWLNSSRSSKLSLALEGDEHLPEPPGPNPDTKSRPRSSSPQGPPDPIHNLMNSPVLYDPIRKPRFPIVLCHGLYGFDVRGPAFFPMLQMHYWSNVLGILRRKVGAEVIVTGVPGTGSIASRSESMDKLLKQRAAGRAINFLAHSMGGLDCRHLISHIKPTEYTPVSLTTIGTPHRGSPFMDWCAENIGIGKLQKEQMLSVARSLSAQLSADNEPDPWLSQVQPERVQPQPKPSSQPKSTFPISLASLPSSFTTLLLSIFDSPAYANLTSTYLNTVFNPATPDDPHVKYFSVAGRISGVSVWHPLWLPKMVLDGFEEKERERGRGFSGHGGVPDHQRWGNDALVTVQSARWGEFLGIMEGCDHWDLRGARGMELSVEMPSVNVPGLGLGMGGGGGQAKAGSEERGGDGWSLGDWGRFVRAFKREEKEAKGMGAAISESRESRRQAEEAKRAEGESAGKVRGKDFGVDDVVNASTEKLSAVFDWIVEQVPSRSPPLPGAPPASSARMEEKRVEKKSELYSKADLERFYVALCKRLYDEGL